MSSTSKRNYQLADGTMLVEAALRAEWYQQYLLDFMKELPKEYCDNFGVSLKNEIGIARSVNSDSHHVQESAHETSVLDEIQNGFYDNSCKILHHAKNKFAGQTHILKRFALGKPQSGGHNRYQFVTKANEYSNLLHEFWEDLLSANCPEALLKETDGMSHKISDQQWERVMSQVNRTGKKLDRIEHLNEIWAKLVQLSEGAKIVFLGKPELIALFALPKRKSRKKSDKSTPEVAETPKE